MVLFDIACRAWHVHKWLDSKDFIQTLSVQIDQNDPDNSVWMLLLHGKEQVDLKWTPYCGHEGQIEKQKPKREAEGETRTRNLEVTLL